MRYHRATAALLILFAVAAWRAPCRAQQVPVEEAKGAATDDLPALPTPELRERKPELHYLLDANGKLIPVPSFRWEDFARILELDEREHPTQELPRAVVDRLEVTGETRDGHAELQAVVDVAVRDAMWRSVLLRFDQAVLREYRAEQGELRLEPVAGGGLLAWVKAESAGTVRLRIKLWRPLEESSAGRRLTLALPRAMNATVALQVPERNAVAELPEAQGMVSSAPGGEGTLIISQLTTELMQLSWRAPPTAPVLDAEWLEASGELSVQVDRDGIATSAQLKLRSAGQPINVFHIKLPAGAVLVPGQYAGYDLKPLDASGDEPRRVEVRLYEPNTVAEVRLQCRQDWVAAAQSIDVGGFAVEEAVRQRGHVAFRVADDVRAEWEERFLVRQVDELPSGLRGASVLAGFEYSGQPFSLLTKIAPRVTRLTVEPQYIVQVTDQELLLNARLRCRVRGGKLHQLKVDLGAWQLDESGWESDGLVAQDDIDVTQTHPLTLPFARAVEGEIELRLQARRPIDASLARIDFTVPRPEGTLVAPAQIVVVAGDNIRLAPHAEAEMNLVAQRPDAAVSLPASRQPPRFYRGDVAQAHFTAEYEIRPASLDASVRTQVEWVDDQLDVRQVIAYRAENAPVDRIRLRVPPALAKAGTLQVRLLGDAPTSLSLAPSENGDQQAELVLPAPQLGAFELEIRHRAQRGTDGRDWDLALVQPAEQTTVENVLRIAADSKWDANVATEGWIRDPREAQLWTAKQPLPLAVVTLRATSDNTPRQDLVQRALVRTQLVNDLRQERVTWRVVAPDGAVTLRLPEGVLPRDVVVTLDGLGMNAPLNSASELTVRWPQKLDANIAHLLVIDFHLEGAGAGLTSRLAPVTLVSAGWLERTDWELLLPESTHLLDVSPEYAREFDWLWNGTHWARESHSSAEELRKQVGIGEEAYFPSPQNRYVLSTFGQPRELVVQSASRSALILVASAVTLALGLTLLFFPALRRAETLLAIAMAAIMTMAWCGDSAVLLLQAALPGAVAASVALLVHRFSSRRLPPASVLQGSTHLAPRRAIPERTRGSSITHPPSTSRGVTPATASELS